MSKNYKEIYTQSIKNKEEFWKKISDDIFWYSKPTKILNTDSPPFYKWFQDGITNTCYNALDFHIDNALGDKTALIWDSPITNSKETYTFNQLREKVTLRVDGGLRGGWEIVMAAILGADEFGFGSIAMIAEGCVMARVCHLNSCPVGVATQRDDLRLRFKGTPEHVVDFFFFMAQEVREILAKLGYRSIDDIIGQTKILKQKEIEEGVRQYKDKYEFIVSEEVNKRATYAKELSKEKSVSFICGHFEGVDERVLSTRNIEEISIGDFILSGGETASLVVLDSILRLLPGVLGNEQSKKDESFENGLLEYPQYTKPQIWEEKSVPEVLLSGDHNKIKDWRLSQSEAITRVRRPDLWEKYKKN